MTDLTGAGQKGITVEAFLKNSDGTRGRRIARTQTDATGDFTLVAGEPFQAQEFLITFAKESFSTLTKVVAYDGTRPVFIGDSLRGKLSVSGRVVSAADQSPVRAHVVFENMFVRLESETGENGSFLFSELSPMQARLEITAEGYGREQKSIRVPMAEPLAIELKPERRVTIRIVDEEGNPIAGAVLECVDQSRDDFRTLITDVNGSGILDGLHFDTKSLSINFSHADFVASAPWGEKIDLREAPLASAHTLIMRRAATVLGMVRESDSGKPLYGARVFAGDVYHDAAPRDWSNTTGEFRLGTVPPGPTALTVHLAGFAPDLKIVDVVAGRPTTVNFDLDGAKTVRGRVLSREGNPVGGIEVAATRWRAKQTLGLRAMTDREGRFIFEDAPADAFDVTVFGHGSETTQTITASGDREIELVVDPGKRPELVKVGAVVPDFNLTMLDGQSVSNESMKGKTVLMVFWATWCGPCLAEVPNLVAVNEKFRGRGDFLMIGVSRDIEESALRDFLKANPKVSWPQAFGKGGGVDEAVQAFGVTGIPAIFLIDSKGKISAADIRDEQIHQTVESLLKANKGL